MAALTLSNIEKSFGDVPILKGIDLDIRDGEFIALVGPSGCGKSTLLRTIAGLEEQDAGTIVMQESALDGLAASKRNLAMVFQSYALYPHLTVAENIAVPLRMRGLNNWQRLPILGAFLPGTAQMSRQIEDKVRAVAQTLDLLHLLDRKPGHLSGGQRQRVAVGRALVREPKAFLLDEPLSNLDAKLRVHMRTEISQLHRRLGATFIYVTHDQAEAMTMSDRIAVMMEGDLLQVGTPDEVYHRPDDIRVAEFIGSPKINILPIEHTADGTLAICGQSTQLRSRSAAAHLGIRPEALSLCNEEGTLRATIRHKENFGSEVYVHVSIEGHRPEIVVRASPQFAASCPIGAPTFVQLDIDRALAFDLGGKRVDKTPEPEKRREVA